MDQKLILQILWSVDLKNSFDICICSWDVAGNLKIIIAYAVSEKFG